MRTIGGDGIAACALRPCPPARPAAHESIHRAGECVSTGCTCGCELPGPDPSGASARHWSAHAPVAALVQSGAMAFDLPLLRILLPTCRRNVHVLTGLRGICCPPTCFAALTQARRVQGEAERSAGHGAAGVGQCAGHAYEDHKPYIALPSHLDAPAPRTTPATGLRASQHPHECSPLRQSMTHQLCMHAPSPALASDLSRSDRVPAASQLLFREQPVKRPHGATPRSCLSAQRFGSDALEPLVVQRLQRGGTVFQRGWRRPAGGVDAKGMVDVVKGACGIGARSRELHAHRASLQQRRDQRTPADARGGAPIAHAMSLAGPHAGTARIGVSGACTWALNRSGTPGPARSVACPRGQRQAGRQGHARRRADAARAAASCARGIRPCLAAPRRRLARCAAQRRPQRRVPRAAAHGEKAASWSAPVRISQNPLNASIALAPCADEPRSASQRLAGGRRRLAHLRPHARQAPLERATALRKGTLRACVCGDHRAGLRIEGGLRRLGARLGGARGCGAVRPEYD